MAKSKASKLKEQLEKLVSKFSKKEKEFLDQKGVELSVLESQVLFYVGDHDYCIMKEISTALSIPKNNLTAIVDKLEGKKLLKRFHSDKDRRAVALTLTSKGENICEAHSEFLISATKDLLKVLKSTEQNDLISTLEKMLD